MSTVRREGTIKAMSRNGKWFCLVEEGEDEPGYSVFNVSQMNGAERGDKVEFAFKEKAVGSRVYNNIVGDVNITEKGDGSMVNVVSVVGSTSEPKAVFGSMTLSRDRCIARQNACNVVSGVLAASGLFEYDEVNRAAMMTDVANLIVTGAKIIEAYTTGDMDKEEAEAAIAMVLTPDEAA